MSVGLPCEVNIPREFRDPQGIFISSRVNLFSQLHFSPLSDYIFIESDNMQSLLLGKNKQKI